MTNEFIDYLVSRLLDRAKEASAELIENPGDEFLSGKRLAYYEVMDIIQTELEVNDYDLASVGLDIDLDKEL